MVGRDFNARATGSLALNDTGQSNLTVHADSPSLAEVGRLIDLPLTGIGMTDATITGNRRELQATGTFIGDGVRYKGQDALVLSTRYTLTVPDLTIANASGSATTDATFVTLGGQNINELTARTDYNGKQFNFDVTAKQPERSVRASGALILDIERHEALVDHLSLQSGNLQWQTPVESGAAIRYTAGQLSITDLHLANGNQAIAVDGTFGRPADKMMVTLSDVSLADVDTLLLRPLAFTGTLNASAEIGGTTAAPTISGMFSVTKGAVRQVPFQSFKGTMAIAGRGVTIDARLEESTENWIRGQGIRATSGLQCALQPQRDVVGRQQLSELGLESFELPQLPDVGELDGLHGAVRVLGQDHDVDQSDGSGVDQGNELTRHLTGEVARPGGELDDDVVDRPELIQRCLCHRASSLRAVA